MGRNKALILMFRLPWGNEKDIALAEASACRLISSRSSESMRREFVLGEERDLGAGMHTQNNRQFHIALWNLIKPMQEKAEKTLEVRTPLVGD